MTISKIICISDGGLANRIRPIFSCFALAEILGLEDTDVSVYWRPTAVCDILLNKLVSTPLIEEGQGLAEKLNRKTLFFYREGSVKNAQKLFKRSDFVDILEKCTGVSLDKIEDPLSKIKNSAQSFNTVIIFDNQMLRPAKALVTAFQDLYLKKLSKLSFNQSIEGNAKHFFLDNALCSSSFGVHARGTDFNVPWTYYSERLHRLDLSKAWFFSSDSDLFNQYVSNNFKNVVTRDKTFPQYSRGIFGFFRKDIYRSGKSVEEAAIDLRILSNLNLKIWHPNSTFAQLAVELRNSRQQESLPLNIMSPH
jgi:hypothetical protein